MQTISDLTINDTTVLLDDKHFVGCTITGCVLEYSGKAVIFETTKFSNCRFLFVEDAGRTVNLLRCFEMMISAHDPVVYPPSSMN